MKDGPDGRIPRRRMRGPDSIWERYLTGKLSLEGKKTFPALLKELHREIAQHLGHNVDAENLEDIEALDDNRAVTPPPMPKLTPIIDINVRRAHIAKRRRIDPRQN